MLIPKRKKDHRNEKGMRWIANSFQYVPRHICYLVK